MMTTPLAFGENEQRSPREFNPPKSPRESKRDSSLGKPSRRESAGKSPRKIHKSTEDATIGLDEPRGPPLNPLIVPSFVTTHTDTPLEEHNHNPFIIHTTSNEPKPFEFVIKPIVIPKNLDVDEPQNSPTYSPRSPRTWQSDLDDEEKRKQLKNDAIKSRNQAEICDDLIYFLDRVEHTQKTGNASQNIKARLQVSYLQNLLRKDESDILHILMPVIESFEATSFQVAIAHSNLSYCCLHKKEYAKAEYWATKGIETHGKGTYFLWENLSAAQKQLGKTEESQQSARKAQQMRKSDSESSKTDVIHWVGKRLSPRKSRDFNIV